MKIATVSKVFLLCLILHSVYSTKDSNKSACNNFELVTRVEWLARPSERPYTNKMPVNKVIILHTANSSNFTCNTKPQCIRTVQFIQEYHLDYVDWNDIGYNFLIGGDGRVYEGRGWTQRGAHTINFNAISIGIAFIGNYMKVEPKEEMLNATLNLIECGVEKGFLTPTREIHGQRDVYCTKAPGDKLYEKIRQWKNYKGGRISQYDCVGPRLGGSHEGPNPPTQ